MLQSSPFFSVLIPTYNQAQYLGAALDSLINQTFTNWEGIIINDGSTDQTKAIIKNYCLKDKRFRTYDKENGGTGSALNVGLSSALGEWICWLSSDDLFENYKLRTHFEWINAVPDCAFFFTHFREMDDITGKLIDSDHWKPLPEKRHQVIEMLRSNYIAGNSICINRTAWKKVGCFDESLRYGQDYDMWLRMMSLYPATYIPVRTCISRLHSLQDGKRFPEAMFYDSAKAAIQFLNHITFDKIFPLIKLEDTQYIWDILDISLNVAEDKRAFVYALGSNPLLILRILEWSSINKESIGKDIRQLLFNRILKASYLNQYKDLSYIWKVASAVAYLDISIQLESIEPVLIAEAFFHRKIAFRGQTQKKISLKRWLERFEKLQLEGTSSNIKGSPLNILLTTQCRLHNHKSELENIFNTYICVATKLYLYGHNVTILSINDQNRTGFEFKSGIFVFKFASMLDFQNALDCLGCFDVVNDLDKLNSSIYDESNSYKSVYINFCSESLIKYIVNTRLKHNKKILNKLNLYAQNYRRLKLIKYDMYFISRLVFEILWHKLSMIYHLFQK